MATLGPSPVFPATHLTPFLPKMPLYCLTSAFLGSHSTCASSSSLSAWRGCSESGRQGEAGRPAHAPDRACATQHQTSVPRCRAAPSKHTHLQGGDDWEAAHKLGDEAVADQVALLHCAQRCRLRGNGAGRAARAHGGTKPNGRGGQPLRHLG